MKISTGPLLKGVGGATAATAATTAAVYGENIYSFFATGSFQIVDETEKIASLGLPNEGCVWPDRYSRDPAMCELDSDKLKKINFFENSSATATNVESGKNFTLTIERLWGDKIFDKGYRFILKNKDENDSATVTINSNLSLQLKKDMNFEFKIKEEGKKWYLERAWDEKTIKERIGLDCSSNSNECSLKGGRKINVIAGNKKVEGISNLNGGKIKLHKNSKDYRQSLKFSIEGDDIELRGGRGTEITKLERDETYEIKKDGDKWYLSRRVSFADVINEKINGLNLPDDCKWKEEHTSDAITCALDKDKLEKINFYDKNGATLTATNAEKVTLKLERTKNRVDYPPGLKVTFVNTEEVTIKKNGNDNFINWKTGTNTEYKIEGSGSSKTLKAWRLVDLADKVGLTWCKNDNTDTCTFSKSFNVMDGGKTAIGVSANLKTLKIEENQNNYSQGFKFTAEENISLNGGTKRGIEKIMNGETYEIKSVNDKWFLSKVTA